MERQLSVLQHWIANRTLYQTLKHTLTKGNIPSKISSKYQAECSVLENILLEINVHEKQYQLAFSSNIQQLIEFSQLLLQIRRLYNERNWQDLEIFLTKLPVSTVSSIRQLQDFKEPIKEIDNCRWLVKYYNILHALRSSCDENCTFSLFSFDIVSFHPSSYESLKEYFTVTSDLRKGIQLGKAMELLDEPVFSSMLDFAEKFTLLLDSCGHLKLDKVETSQVFSINFA